MPDFKLSPRAMVMIQGSSKGTQPKYYDQGWWYKANRAGYEATAEYLASIVLSCSNVSDYVTYELCTINGRSGCRSRSFLKPDESFISFERLYEMNAGGHLTDAIYVLDDVDSRIVYVKDFIREVTGLDCSLYLSQILSLDMLLLNDDRHFNNLGIVINNESGACRPAPIFDNGDALLSDYGKYDAETIEENIDKVVGRPFSANLEIQAAAAGIGLKIDYEMLEAKLAGEPDSRALKVLRHQLIREQSLIKGIHE